MTSWQQQLQDCKDNIDRALLARDPATDVELLAVFCYRDLDPLVVGEAAANPSCPDEYVKVAISRFPLLDNPDFFNKRENNKKLAEIGEQGSKFISGDRDQIILKHIMSADHASSHLGANSKKILNSKYRSVEKPWDPTDKLKIVMLMPPSWGIIFPPYNIAKLSAVLRQHGHAVKVNDLNIESHHYLKNLDNKDYWESQMYFLWSVKENFYTHLLPKLDALFAETVEKIAKDRPDVIGMSLYNTNVHAAEYLLYRLREKLPNACYLAGGPEVPSSGGDRSWLRFAPFNYLFNGEAEETLPALLENLPNILPQGKVIGTNDSRLSLESYPYPDYSDYVLSNYSHRNGVSIETSRGCVAQCSFCAETYFWRFRSLNSERVIEEIKHQIANYDVRRFWFVDSLANGDIKNFKKLVDLILSQNIQINWNSYARCDGRMDLDFFKQIVNSGCTCLSFGIESGSQKVLQDMRKKIEVWEIENNLRDAAIAGLYSHVNWILGFPTEEPLDFLHSLQLIANARYHIDVISPGYGAGPAAQSHMVTDWKLYKMVGDEYLIDKTFLGTWYTEEYRNTVLHRFLRVKMFHVWLDILMQYAGSRIENSQRFSNIGEFFTFKPLDTSTVDYIKNDEFVNVDRCGTNEFKNTVANEYFPIMYALWIYFGACEFTFVCDPEKDIKLFGDTLVNDYRSEVTFKINELGIYSYTINHEFKHRAFSDRANADLYESERLKNDLSFVDRVTVSGNINDWKTTEIQTKETVHSQYRNKNKRVIPIKS